MKRMKMKYSSHRILFVVSVTSVTSNRLEELFLKVIG
jgi:hypothetical protein